MTRRIVKVGGSLLGDVNLPKRLSCWLSRYADDQNILLVGGGSLVDCVRRWDQTFGLSSDFAHWSSLELMSLNARMLQQRLPGYPLIESTDQLFTKSVCIFDVRRMLRAHDPLPASWDVTSDTIAAWLAGQLHAGELVLMKSTSPCSSRIADWSVAGLVDRAFERTAGDWLTVSIVNLTDPTFPVVRAKK